MPDSVLNSSVQSNAVTEDCIIAYKILISVENKFV